MVHLAKLVMGGLEEAVQVFILGDITVLEGNASLM